MNVTIWNSKSNYIILFLIFLSQIIHSIEGEERSFFKFRIPFRNCGFDFSDQT